MDFFSLLFQKLREKQTDEGKENMAVKSNPRSGEK